VQTYAPCCAIACRLRESLGLKPLREGSQQAERDAEASLRHREEQQKKEKEARAAQFKQLQAQ
jgi:hypothetical protein